MPKPPRLCAAFIAGKKKAGPARLKRNLMVFLPLVL